MRPHIEAIFHTFTVLIGATVYNIIVKSMICKTIVLIKYTAF